MDMTLVYLAPVILVLVLGFVWALRMGMAASVDADRAWPESAQEAPHALEAQHEVHVEPAATAAAY